MRQMLHATQSVNWAHLSHDYMEITTSWPETFHGQYNIIGTFSNENTAKVGCLKNFGLRDVGPSQYIQCASWDHTNPPLFGDNVDVWAFATDEDLNSPPEQFIHLLYQCTQKDLDNGYVSPSMVWPIEWTGVYNLQTSFCYRSTNPPLSNSRDSRRSVVYNSGVVGVTSKGYQPVLYIQPGNAPSVNDYIDFWGYGSQ